MLATLAKLLRKLADKLDPPAAPDLAGGKGDRA